MRAGPGALMHAASTRRGTLTRALAAAVVVWALLWAQAAARIHAIEHPGAGLSAGHGLPRAGVGLDAGHVDAHPGTPPGAHANSNANSNADSHVDSHAAHWGHQEGSAACVLLDQWVSEQASAGPGPHLALPSARQPQPPAPGGPPPARAAAGAYQARAPPAG